MTREYDCSRYVFRSLKYKTKQQECVVYGRILKKFIRVVDSVAITLPPQVLNSCIVEHMLISWFNNFVQGLTEVSKFKGHANSMGLPISASASAQGEYIICGSEEGRVYIWNNQYVKDELPKHQSVPREKVNSYEYFRGHDGFATVALLAPDTCRRSAAGLDGQQGIANCPITTSGFRERIKNAAKTAAYAIPHAIPGHHHHHISDDGNSSHGVANGDERDFRLLGQVIVTAGGDGEIRVWENFGLPVKQAS